MQLGEIPPFVKLDPSTEYLDAIRVKARQDGRFTNKAVYLAVEVNLDGLNKEILGL